MDQKKSDKKDIGQNGSSMETDEDDKKCEPEVDRSALVSLQLIPRIGIRQTERRLALAFQQRLPHEFDKLKKALMKCVPLFPIQVGSVGGGAAVGSLAASKPRVKRVVIPLICDKKLAEGALSGPTFCSLSRIVLVGDEIVCDEGEFKLKVSWREAMMPRLVSNFRLKQIRESASQFGRALALTNAIRPTEIKSVTEALELLQPIIEAIELAQALFLPPHARKLEQEHVEMADKKCVFQGQPKDFEVNFYIDDHKLVFRATVIYPGAVQKAAVGCGAPATPAASAVRSNFKISVTIPWARELGIEFVQALCVAKKLGHLVGGMRFVAEDFGEFK